MEDPRAVVAPGASRARVPGLARVGGLRGAPVAHPERARTRRAGEGPSWPPQFRPCTAADAYAPEPGRAAEARPEPLRPRPPRHHATLAHPGPSRRLLHPEPDSRVPVVLPPQSAPGVTGRRTPTGSSATTTAGGCRERRGAEEAHGGGGACCGGCTGEEETQGGGTRSGESQRR